MIKLDFDQLLSPTSKTLTTMADQDNLPPFQFMPRSMEHDFEKQEKLREIYQYVRLITKQDASRTTLTQVYSRNSFTEAVSIVFVPVTQAIIFNKCKAHDTLIKAEAETEINKNLARAPPEMFYVVRLRTQFEVQDILYKQYRYACYLTGDQV